MKLILLFDQRFLRSPDGIVFSTISYNYQFFADRYLPVFDQVNILARVADSDVPERNAASPTEGPGVRVLSLPDWTGPAGYLVNRRRIVRMLRENLDRETAVIIVAPGGIGTILISKLQRCRHPFAVEVMGDPWDAFGPGAVSHPLRALFRHSLRRMMKRQCSKAVAALYVTKSALQQRYPGPALTAGISDVVLREQAFRGRPRAFLRPAVTLVNVARMAQLYKGQDLLINAMASCISRGMDIRLILVGDGSMTSLLQKLAVRAGITGRVNFAGALSPDSVREQLDRADLFVLPSRTEGLPRALVEAMARGLPCIATSVGGVPELLPEEDLVPPRDSEALAQKIQDIVGDTERLTRMSSRNLLRAREYAENILVPARVEFYRRFSSLSQELLSRSNGARGY